MSDAGLPECFSLLFICKVTLLCRETCERDEVEPSKNNAKKGGGGKRSFPGFHKMQESLP